MKKILTLFTMLLVTVSTLLAQAPSLSYQMIVRNQKTDTVGTFAPNDLVYNKSMNVYVAVVEATGNVAKEWAFTGNGTGNGMIAPKATTNMNGMLSLTLSDYQPVELPDGYQIPTTVDATVELKWFNEIEWQDAKVVLAIPEYGIMDTMEILPVPFAYKTFMKRNITTPRIVKYIENATPEDDVAAVDETITGNVPFMNALRDSVANAIKRNPGKTKELALYFIGLITPEDVENAADTVSQDVMEFVKDTVVKYIKNHRTEAYNLVKYYIGQTTKEDVSGFWNAAMNNAQVYEIAKMIVDSVNEYIKRNPELATKTAKYVVRHLTAEDVFTLQNYTKTNNPAAYDTAKGILNDLIDDYMAANQYQKVQCDVTDLCALMNEIEQFKEYGTVVCPTIGATTYTATNDELKTPFTNNGNAQNIQAWYELTFPNSNYSTVLIPATVNGNEITAILPQDYKNRNISVRPKMTAECMDTETFGPATEIECQVQCKCPDIASFTHTSDAAGDLINYHGVVLKATMTNNYYQNTSANCGFEYKDGNGDWAELKNTNSPAVLSNDGLTVSDTIKMNFCGKTILVRPYVKCGNDKFYGQYSDGVTITLRQFDLFISPESPVTGPTEFTVRNGIYIGSDEFGTHWPSVEQIVEKYGNQYGVDVEPTYQWESTNYSQTGKTVTIETSGNYKVTCTIPALFNSNENCVLEKTFSITVQQ